MSNKIIVKKYAHNILKNGLKTVFPGCTFLTRSFSDFSVNLKDVLSIKIPREQEKIQNFRKKYGQTKVGEITVDMIYSGMRGIQGLICETSNLDPNNGIHFRGYPMSECLQLLPKAYDGLQPLPESMFWLLITGDIPNNAQVKALSKEWAARASLPTHIHTILHNLPTTLHPMSQLSSIVTILNQDSKFVAAYKTGISKSLYWEYIYEDCMDLIAKLPVIAAIIYHHTYKNDSPVRSIDNTKDWSFNFAKMLGFDNHAFIELMRLYLTIHSDHEGGNVSAHTTHLVGSALSDPYISFAAGLNGLAGPINGLANQEVITWLNNIKEQLGNDITDEKLKKYILDSLKSGQVIPGYGHAVLRTIDPRYICQREFAVKHLPKDPLFKLVSQLYEVVPHILTEIGKVKNPWPNVDALSGVLLQHYGLKETNYYTVLFGVSRALGVLASLVWDRALGFPTERPKSYSTNQLMNLVKTIKPVNTGNVLI